MRLRIGHRRASQIRRKGVGGCLRGLGGAGVAVSVPSTRVEGNCMQFDPESTTAKICDSRKHSTRASVRSHVHTHYTSMHVRARMHERTRAPTCRRTHLHEPTKEDETQTRTARAHAHRCRHCSARTDRPRLALGSAHCPRTAAAHHRLPTASEPLHAAALSSASGALIQLCPTSRLVRFASPLIQSDTSVRAKHSHTHARVMHAHTRARATPATMSRGCQVAPSCSDVTATV